MPAAAIMNLPVSQPTDRPPNWNDVEQRLEVLRQRRKDLGTSFSDLEQYYESLVDPKTTGSKTLAEHLPRLEQWQAELPKSSSALVAAAKAYLRFAWEARGSGWAATVTPDGWRLFAARVGKAHGLLDRAIEMGVKDGEAYALLAIIGYAEGAPREQVDTWLKAGRKLDLTYYSMYQEMAVYLLPRWMGEKGDIEQFAGDMARKIGGDNGLEAFARIAFSIQRYECGWGETLVHGQYDPELLMCARK